MSQHIIFQSVWNDNFEGIRCIDVKVSEDPHMKGHLQKTYIWFSVTSLDVTTWPSQISTSSPWMVQSALASLQSPTSQYRHNTILRSRTQSPTNSLMTHTQQQPWQMHQAHCRSLPTTVYIWLALLVGMTLQSQDTLAQGLIQQHFIRILLVHRLRQNPISRGLAWVGCLMARVL